MKRILLICIAAAISLSLHAETRCEDVSLAIENTYLEQMMAAQNILESGSIRDLQIAAFLSENIKRFNPSDMMMIRGRLAGMSESQLMVLNGTEFKSPTAALLLSVFFGSWGVDRFYIGDIGAGVGKLLTGGGLGIWWLIDLFTISNKAKKNNAEDFAEVAEVTELY